MHLEISGLSVVYDSNSIPVKAVDGITLSIPKGSTTCLIGESGSGKTTLALAVVGLLPDSARVVGDVRLEGKPLLHLAEREMREIRRRDIGIVFQDATASLVPNRRVGEVLRTVVAFRSGLSRKAAAVRVLELAEMVHLPDPHRTLRSYPRQLSGGMCQRVCIALAMASLPRLLIADEAVSALDCVSQVEILDLIFSLQRAHKFSIMYVTHDLRIARRFDTVGVLRCGKLLEFQPVEGFFMSPHSDYGSQLLAAAQRLSTPPRE
jgi:ABC-type dipeptide/oligopeptide/nickel transport system ATPase component